MIIAAASLVSYLIVGGFIGRIGFVKILGDDDRVDRHGYATSEYSNALTFLWLTFLFWPMIIPLTIILVPIKLLLRDTPAEIDRQRKKELEEAQDILDPKRVKAREKEYYRSYGGSL